MKISFKFSINFTRGTASVHAESDEKTPQGDVFASAERSSGHTIPELQTGFQRDNNW